MKPTPTTAAAIEEPPQLELQMHNVENMQQSLYNHLASGFKIKHRWDDSP